MVSFSAPCAALGPQQPWSTSVRSMTSGKLVAAAKPLPPYDQTSRSPTVASTMTVAKFVSLKPVVVEVIATLTVYMYRVFISMVKASTMRVLVVSPVTRPSASKGACHSAQPSMPANKGVLSSYKHPVHSYSTIGASKPSRPSRQPDFSTSAERLMRLLGFCSRTEAPKMMTGGTGSGETSTLWETAADMLAFHSVVTLRVK
mmetsp:Transcript_142247/g.354468  ORF Transcript_142247/g.354468 Transcript_142247/m.354468 type:complete len:202 (-) Transcript_142247:2124-2729(-)